MTLHEQMLRALEDVLREARHGRFCQISTLRAVRAAVDAAGGRRLDVPHYCPACGLELAEEVTGSLCSDCEENHAKC